ncbi:SpoIIE family protein phosphatase [Streptomyces sp. CB02400]|uniref:SpoIIE family protein phosphatase n=1 Tax=Streptomyces sp. CB02400 TaxID=1703944 RepID=UPI00094064F9|nr:SpoIIE family protein phosphatase [Streptomyces sp. CB02400]OKK04032.1 hypothetical protein AMK33_24280 [Streptomyces sp. CB02400]
MPAHASSPNRSRSDFRRLPGEQLEPGDRLLFHTDGINEARDATGRMSGPDRFVDFLVRHHADEVPLPETRQDPSALKGERIEGGGDPPSSIMLP